MMPAFDFVTPWLLLGLLAAGIPFLLHLLSSVRAQEVYFPTLRFLRSSMEKTARRRRIQHWLLLVLRAALLCFLALAVAEPISRATGGWLAGRRYAAAVILDNSFSMAAKGAGGASRLAQAKIEAASLLGGTDSPALAAVLTTNGGAVSKEMNANFPALREGVDQAAIGFGRADIGQQVGAALEMLRHQSIPQKSVYVFSDLQRISFDDLPGLEALAKSSDVHLLIVNTAGKGEVNNVGISNLEIAGLRIVNQELAFTATLVNSSQRYDSIKKELAGLPKSVDVGLRINGQDVGLKVRTTLAGPGEDGSIATVKFRHRFADPGPVAGEVYIEQSDDLPLDNVRRFCLVIGGRVSAVVVRGPSGGADAPSLDPAMMLRVALDPFGGAQSPWSITPKTVEAEQFSPADLEGVDSAFFCEVPSFNEPQAQAVEQFARGGGTVVFFLGPDVQVQNYNDRFLESVKAEGGLLPARLADAVGEVGTTAEAVPIDWVDTRHPYFEGLFADQADYLVGQVQRYYRVAPSANPGRTLVRLKNGDPLLMLKAFGKGKVILCTTTASPRWASLLSSAGRVFVPMVIRASLLAGQELGHDNTVLAGSQVPIRLGPLAAKGNGAESLDKLLLSVSLPGDESGKAQTVTVTAGKTEEGYAATFDDTSRLGVYKWRLAQATADQPEAGGEFAVNPNGVECQLQSMTAQTLLDRLHDRGIKRAYIAPSLDEVNKAAQADAQGRNWWDVLLAIVIVLLVVEAVVSNRLRQAREDAIPAHLNPKVAP